MQTFFSVNNTDFYETNGVAIDVGTTTVAAALVNLRTGEETANAAEINAQKHYGVDVLTRITYELENPQDGAAALQQKITSSLDEMILSMCTETGVAPETIYEVLAAIRELVGIGLIGKNGTLLKEASLAVDDYRRHLLRSNGKKREVVLWDNLYITQADIRQVQLAKGAILSGFYALLRKMKISMADLDEVLIAGQFGSHLPAASLTGTGILPEEIADRLRYVGNSSKAGAYMALLSGKEKREMETLAQKIDYIELGTSPDYERLFSQCLLFPDKTCP